MVFIKIRPKLLFLGTPDGERNRSDDTKETYKLLIIQIGSNLLKEWFIINIPFHYYNCGLLDKSYIREK